MAASPAPTLTFTLLAVLGTMVVLVVPNVAVGALVLVVPLIIKVPVAISGKVLVGVGEGEEAEPCALIVPERAKRRARAGSKKESLENCITLKVKWETKSKENISLQRMNRQKTRKKNKLVRS